MLSPIATASRRLAARRACLVVQRPAVCAKTSFGTAAPMTLAGHRAQRDGRPAGRTHPGIRLLDRVSAASAWMRKAPEKSPAQPSPELEEAFVFLDRFNRGAAPHLEEDDNVNDAACTLRQAFFDASDWLAPTRPRRLVRTSRRRAGLFRAQRAIGCTLGDR